jgi:hypothetical protein
MGGVGPAFPKWCKSITFETNAESNRIDIRAAGDHASCCWVNLAVAGLGQAVVLRGSIRSDRSRSSSRIVPIPFRALALRWLEISRAQVWLLFVGPFGAAEQPAKKRRGRSETLLFQNGAPESAPEKKPAASAPAPVEPATQQHATTTAQPARQLTASDLRRMADNQSKAAAKQPPSDTTAKEPPPFPIPGVPISWPDEENGVCWCGGPDQQFPCEPCRLKRDANNLDLKAVAEPKLRVPKTRLPHPFSSRCSTRKGGIPQLPPCRLSETCTLPPVPCSPVVDAVNTARNHIPCRIQTVTRKKVTVSRFGAHPKNRPLNSVALEQNQQTEGGPTIP